MFYVKYNSVNWLIENSDRYEMLYFNIWKDVYTMEQVKMLNYL